MCPIRTTWSRIWTGNRARDTFIASIISAGPSLIGETVDQPVPPDLERDFIFASRRLVMYPDLNAAGRLFGGQLMGWLDEATAQVAARIMGTKNLVTKKFG